MLDPKHTSFNQLSSLIDPETMVNNSINTIKLLRQITGKDLKEVVEFFEEVWKPFVLSQPSSRVGDTFKPPIGVDIDDIATFEGENKTFDLPPPMYLVGHSYKQLDGCTVMILGVSNPNTSYETVYTLNSNGNVVHRYNRRDFGRCINSDPQNPDPQNLEILT